MASTRLKSGDIVEIISLKRNSGLGPLSGVKIGDQVKVDTYNSNDETWLIFTKGRGTFIGWIPRKNIRPVTKTTTAKPKAVPSPSNSFAVDEAFIKEAHKAACPEWKKKLETKFPTVLKKQDEYLKIPTRITLDASNDIWIGNWAAPAGKENRCIMSSTHQPIVSKANGRWMVEFKKIVK